MKQKRHYVCTQCGASSQKWAGQCGQCGQWNCLVEETQAIPKSGAARYQGYAGQQDSRIQLLKDVEISHAPRVTTELSELDRVLGGGLVKGSVVLIGGDPGIGKSTLLLQTLTHLSFSQDVLYVTGEESLQQIGLRAKRLQLNADKVKLLTETQTERIIDLAAKEKPQVMVIDSIQTLHTAVVSSAPGGVSQVRESAAQLVQFAKSNQVALFLVGHVTKEGALAGPRVLEHMVDAVLYFEGQSDSRYRIIRAIKNRFGAVNELGVFAMTEHGLREVANPSAIFLSRAPAQTPGSVVMVTWEGSRPMLVEVQALVDSSHAAQPRRVTIGLEHNRLAMLLAVMHRHAGIVSYDQDVFLNVVGGVRVSETAADLALLMSALSSLRSVIIPKDWVVFGEVGLSGEIRPVQSGQERIKEAYKHGFKKAIVPAGNFVKGHHFEGMEICPVSHIREALELI